MAQPAPYNAPELKRRMHGAVDALKHDFGGLRTGRASISLVEPIHVDAYGANMPLNQVASVTVPEARLLQINVWDKGLVIGVAAGFLENFLTLSHMNVRWHVGWFSRIWCAPQVHRIHHSLEPQHIDKNFAFQFPMWDVIFGTYFHPRKGEFPATGVAGEPGFSSFWEAQIYSQREMWRYLRRKRQKPAS